jgi:hypothetical protein
LVPIISRVGQTPVGFIHFFRLRMASLASATTGRISDRSTSAGGLRKSCSAAA